MKNISIVKFYMQNNQFIEIIWILLFSKLICSTQPVNCSFTACMCVNWGIHTKQYKKYKNKAFSQNSKQSAITIPEFVSIANEPAFVDSNLSCKNKTKFQQWKYGAKFKCKNNTTSFLQMWLHISMYPYKNCLSLA